MLVLMTVRSLLHMMEINHISCRVAQTPHYFELTRMADRGSANVMGHHLSELSRKGTAPALAADCFDHRGRLREAIERKARKKYETDGRPIGLLVFIDSVFHPPHMPPEWAQGILEEKGAEGTLRFGFMIRFRSRQSQMAMSVGREL
jgi:hypothetical protein